MGTAAEKTELWDRWKRGESLKAIGRAFGKPSSSIYFLVAPHGGIRPAERRRSRLALTLAEREVISRGVTAHQSARSIAKLLGRTPSTVSREMSRNGGRDRYRATLADENALARSRRPKCGSAPGGRDVHCENGNGRTRDDHAVGHRVESGRIVALVRDPEGAAGEKRNAPRVHQMRVGCHGESGDVRDQIRLNIDGRIGDVGGRRVRMELRFHDCSSMMQRHIDRPVQAVRS
jgi:DNA-binding CsgD family transcriptional regulator